MKFFIQSVLITVVTVMLISCAEQKSKEAIKNYNIPEIDKLTQELKKSPNNAALYAARSLMFTENNLFQEAELDAEKALSLDSLKLDYYELLSDAYFANNHSHASVKTLQRAIGKFPNESVFYLNLSEKLLYLEQYKDCAITLDMLFKIAPDHPEGIFIRGQARKLTGDTIEAIKDFEKVIAIDADHLDAYMELALLYHRDGNPLTISYIDNVLRIDSMYEEALLAKAQFYHFKSEFEKAKTEYENALVKIPQSSNLNYNLALMFLEMGDNAKNDKEKSSKYFESSLRHFDNSTKFDPQFADAYYYKAIAALRMGRKDLAIRDYENALRLSAFLGTISPDLVEQELAKLKQ
jgi:tetratricopeptide (TPR) repeat protein